MRAACTSLSFLTFALAALRPVFAQRYSTWHLVDAGAVVCEEDPLQYSIGINFTDEQGNPVNGIDLHTPYIFSFIRLATGQVDVSFTVTDANGEVVVPETTVSLRAASDPVPNAGCSCLGEGPAQEFRSLVGADYGSSCQAWDNSNCSGMWPELTPGEWCCRPWCYSTEQCNDAFTSVYNPGKHFSYLACSTTPADNPCPWVQEQEELCKCRDVTHLFSDEMLANFGTGYGATCKAYDNTTCHIFYPNTMDTWCCQSWCYVDSRCPTARPQVTYGMQDTLFWTTMSCKQDNAAVAQCPYADGVYTGAASEACECTGEQMPESYRPAGAPADYGQECAPHDELECDSYNPGATTGMWCCYSWCWVNSSCSTARASVQWPGHYYTTDAATCPLDEEAIGSCNFSKDCDCVASNEGANLTDVFAAPADYGTSCQAWDKDHCQERWATSDFWNHSGVLRANDWCCDSWCYVSAACPIGRSSVLGSSLAWSFTVCEDLGPQAYIDDSNDCRHPVRRMQQLEQEGEELNIDSTADAREDDDEYLAIDDEGWRETAASAADPGNQEDVDVVGRRLAGRRRSPARRRASGPPVVEARRRYVSTNQNRPAATTQRRRAPVRRRVDVRRRTPPVTANIRRRGADVSGHKYSSASTGGTPYGFGSPQHLASNYGGSYPSPTSYGYTGAGALASGTATILAMYGSSGGSFFDGRRRWAGPNRRRRQCWEASGCPQGAPTQWCKVSADSSCSVGAGRFMECNECNRVCGVRYCIDASGCNKVTGCSYTLAQDATRDDLLSTGFIPGRFKSPLIVRFKSISGDQMTRADLYCGEYAELAESRNLAMSFSSNFFITLTNQDLMGSSTSCPKETGYLCKPGSRAGQTGHGPCYGDNEVCSLDQGTLICSCQAGYCATSDFTCAQATNQCDPVVSGYTCSASSPCPSTTTMDCIGQTCVCKANLCYTGGSTCQSAPANSVNRARSFHSCFTVMVLLAALCWIG